ncbi:MAG: hypothetical protein NVSMB49_03310 [Ktedonobacteraceae bacterium]
MPASIITTRDVRREKTLHEHSNGVLQNVLVLLVALLLFGIGVWMRLRDLGLPFDRDGYDEGVYWQSLRAMSSGYHLYQQIFYSQPPFFLLSIFPTYTLFGQTLWAARLGVALVSLLGLVGAFLLGNALSGRIGGLAALLLLVVDPLYLQQSQTLQAEAPFVAFSLLAIGATYLWWKRPDGMLGLCYAALSGIALSLSIFCKLFGVATLVPIGLLFLAHIWRVIRQEPKSRLMAFRSLLIGTACFLLVSIALIVPFVSSLHQMIQDVITFHTDAGNVYRTTKASNTSLIEHALTSLLTIGALYGTLVALLWRDWRVLPLLVWLATTALLLWLQVPLFTHHLVALIAPLIALTVMGIRPLRLRKPTDSRLSISATVISVVILVLLTVVQSIAIEDYYRSEVQKSRDIAVTTWDLNVARDLQHVIQPNQLVITDAQFLAGRANRNTDPLLVDTSNVRINTGYLTPQQLITEASQPQVHAVLFYTQRLLSMKHIGLFYAWLMKHYHRVQNYYAGKELWVKIK